MYRTFNMGIGMVLVVSAVDAEKIRTQLEAQGEVCHELQGTVLEINEVSAETEDASPHYAAKVSLPLESQADLHPGMKAQVKIALN